MNNEWQLKKTMIDIGSRIWTRGYAAANDGNISVRLNEKEILTTPTGVSKGFMTSEMIIRLDMEGNVLSGSSAYRPSSEAKMHLEVYRSRQDVNSVIHAHPPFCTSFAVAGLPLDKCVLPEAVLSLGAVPIAPYGTPSTFEIPESIKSYIQNTDVVLLANHGALTLGSDLMNAYFKMETLEHSANIVYRSIQLGNVNILGQEDVSKLLALRERLNLPGKISLGDSCAAEPESPAEMETLVEQVTKKVMEKMGGGSK